MVPVLLLLAEQGHGLGDHVVPSFDESGPIRLVGGAQLFTEPNAWVDLTHQREQTLGQQITELFSSRAAQAWRKGYT